MPYPPYESCPRCGEVCSVRALPDNPLTLYFTCPICRFHDRWAAPTPPVSLQETNPELFNQLYPPGDGGNPGQKLRDFGARTGMCETCSACGDSVNVHRHHTVSIEGYTCKCGHASVWATAQLEAAS